MTIELPWPAGAATGIGSLPGTDIGEAVRMTFGELPDLPYLPELPARGPGADMIGRAAGLLVDLPVELYAARWQVTSRAGRDLRRTRDLWGRDLDALTGQAAEYDGVVKIQVAGPWTLAAALYRPTGGLMLRDRGAVRDLTASLAEGVRHHVADVSARLPHARVLLQLDEPSLPGVLAGDIPTESGFSRLAPVPEGDATEALRAVLDAAGAPVVVHCCAPAVPVKLLSTAGAVGVALDLSLAPDPDALGELLDAGFGLFAGTVKAPAAGAGTTPAGPGTVSGAGTTPAGAGTASDPGGVADRVRRLWRDLGLTPARLPAQVVLTPACGLAGATPDAARATLETIREAARRLAEDPGD